MYHYDNPDPDQVTIEQKAIGLNYIDTYHRSGLYPLKMPSGLGLEGAGTVSYTHLTLPTIYSV